MGLARLEHRNLTRMATCGRRSKICSRYDIAPNDLLPFSTATRSSANRRARDARPAPTGAPAQTRHLRRARRGAHAALDIAPKQPKSPEQRFLAAPRPQAHRRFRRRLRGGPAARAAGPRLLCESTQNCEHCASTRAQALGPFYRGPGI